MARKILFLIVMTLVLVACSPRFTRVTKPEQHAQFLAIIHNYNQQTKQLNAALDVKASGVMASFVHEQVDVVVREPQYLYMALRSFFGPPSMIAASNGSKITMYDFTGQGENAYQQIPLKEDSFFEFMDFSIHPQSLINLLLAKIPLDNAHNVDLKALGEKLEITAEFSNGFRMRAVFDHGKRQLLKTRLMNDALGVTYDMSYQNYEEIAGIYFPTSCVLFAKTNSRFMRFNIAFHRTEINGAEILPDVFYLEPR